MVVLSREVCRLLLFFLVEFMAFSLIFLSSYCALGKQPQ